MSSATLSRNRHRKSALEQLDALANFTHKLLSAAVLTVAPTFTVTFDDPDGADASAELSITNGQINASVVVSNGKNVSVGKAVLFHVAGGVKGKTYCIRVKSGNAAEPVKIVDCLLSIDT